MATTPIEVRAPAGLTITADVFPENSDTAAQSGITLTEATNRKGIYDGEVTATVAGWHTVHVIVSGTVIAVWDILLADDTSTYYTHDRDREGALEATIGAPVGTDISADIAAVKAETSLIVGDTNELQVDWADGGRLDLILDLCSTITISEVATEISDALTVDTVTLPGQEAPPLTPTRDEMYSWIYKVLRNRKDQTATLWQLYADNQSTVDAKAIISDDTVTAIKQEIVAGP
jgi:hypothetical protein